jgi:hypothetical protein
MRSRLLIVASAAAAGALVSLLAGNQEWASLTVTGQARQHVAVTGRQVNSALPALAIALVALAVAVIAARGFLRRLVALAGAAVAVVDVVVAVYARHDVGNALAARVFGLPPHALGATGPHPWWWWPAVVGCVVSAVAFGAIAVAGGTWHGLGARYDAPQAAARQKDPDVAAWEALDRGDDPTA